MEINMDMIVMIITAAITAIFGWAAKKWNWRTKEYIPFQNILIGVLGGVLVFFTKLNDNLLSAIILCTVSAMTAGGTYDVCRTKKEGK